MPAVPMISLAGGFIGLALMLTRKKTAIAKVAAEQQQAAAEAQKQKPAEERIEDYLAIDPMELEIGIGLIRLADPKRGGDLLPRITGVRQAVAAEIGIVLPKVRIRDNMRLGENSYRIRIASNTVAENYVYPDRLLAMSSGLTSGRIPGEETRDPAFEQPAVWIEQGVRDRAELLGYTPIEPAAVVATHLKEIVRRHADELLTRDATKHLIEELKKTSPAVVEELIPGMMKLSEVQQVLQLLLREEIPIRQLGVILETLGDYAGRTKDPIWLTEYVRHRLARTICSRYRDSENRLHVVTLDPAMEDRIAAGIEHSERGLFIRMSPQTQEKTCQALAQGVRRLIDQGKTPIVLVSPQIRPGLRQITQSSLPRLKVLSYNEITRDTQIESHGLVSDMAPAAAKA
jgi:flagellar biosynthesis protein FlhA